MAGGVRVAILGATGAVGQELIRVLEERDFPVRDLRLLATARSAGRTLPFRGEEVRVEAVSPQAFQGVDLALFSAGASVSRAYAPVALEAGATVVDNSSAFRMEPEIPLVVPEVNGHLLKTGPRIVANPNCSTAILVMALAPLGRAAGLRRVIVSTYQAVSGAGARAMQELEDQVRAWIAGRPMEAAILPYRDGARHRPIAFNLLPQCDRFEEMGYTKEEWKLVHETRKILGEAELPVTATTVRVPVLRSHSESVYLETERPLEVEEARRLLAEAPGVAVLDDPEAQVYPTPMEASGKDPVFVGRIRKDPFASHGLNLWVVGDQIRKGAALNAVQIAEGLAAPRGWRA
ncbi:aspartate-semialdehyde dehydrogenase [Limnochorda pilosa]|uniref:Aspartate-semialdehyde dehydrogenase n=1 Tax=Limnochorda pilosa TaxID=1555112 RepID=A0A0K2SMQ6_LIMPI|nr:aspartate-semialdehyde dehydrogenase [Limnochorda pilosa]BAS28396.1 aspartate semialdehyde dehydrogenase [Limnochorda pilosa]